MNPISTSFLFHFTKEFDTLKLILQNGLRYSYSIESFPIEIIKHYLRYTNTYTKGRIYPYICLPLISFCDTPLTRVDKHAKIYGKYFIGIEKSYVNFSNSTNLNPILYANSSEIQKCLSDFFSILRNFKSIGEFTQSVGSAFTSIQEKLNDLNCFDSLISNSNIAATFIEESNRLLLHRLKEIVAIYKPIKGVNRNCKEYYFIDEREWRTFLPDEIAPWKWGLSKTVCSANIETWTETIDEEHRFYTIIPPFLYCINHIAVEYESQREEIINLIKTSPKLFGWPIYNQKERDRFRDLLISKVTSFEKIENDF